jgi:hypothetical protein
MKLSNVGSSKFRRLRYGGLQWWFQILSSAGPFADGKFVSIHPSAFDLCYGGPEWFQTFFWSSTGVFMDEIIVGPSKARLLRLWRAVWVQSVPFVSNSTLSAPDGLP